MRARPSGRAVAAAIASTPESYSLREPLCSAALNIYRLGSGNTSGYRGRLAVGSCKEVYGILTCLGGALFESVRPPRAAWRELLRVAAKRFGNKHEGPLPQPKVKGPTGGYKHASAALPLACLACASPAQSREKRGESDFEEGGQAEIAALVSACAVAINTDAAPEWLQLIPAGKFSAVDGRGPFDNRDPDSIIAESIARMPQVGLVLDYDHSTDLAAPEGRPAPAAGWIKQFKVENGAIFARIEWTADAAEAVIAKKYRYVSPVFEHNEDGKVERILRAALTNNPALVNLPAIAHAIKAIKEDGINSVITMAKKKMAAGEKSTSDIVAGLEDLFPDMPPQQILEMAGAALGAGSDGKDDDGGDDDGETAAGQDPNDPYGNENPDQMAARQADEMAKCSTDGEKAELAAKHAAEKERFAKRSSEVTQMSAIRPLARSFTGEAKGDGSAMTKAQLEKAVARHPRVIELMAKMSDLEANRARDAATQRVDAAIHAGRLLPVQRDVMISYALADAGGFAKFIGAQPRILQAGADGTFTGRIGDAPQGASIFNERQLEIFANLGLESKEQLEKCAAVQSKWDLRFPRPSLRLDDTNSGKQVEK